MHCLWFKTYLGEAYHRNGQLSEAHDLALQAYELAVEIQHWWGVGIAQRVLARIAPARGDSAEAAAHFQAALQLFDSMPSYFELARTHLDLATFTQAQGAYETATIHLKQAYAQFHKLQVPAYVAHTEQLAHAYGVTLGGTS